VGGMMAEIQTPFISDMSIKEVVNAAKNGDFTPAPTRTIPIEIIFKYALTELDGDCSVRDLYARFRNDGVSKAEVTSILKDYEVVGTPPAMEPEIEIDDELYYLAPAIPAIRQPRRLIRVIAFEREFEAKWAEILASRVPRSEKTGETVPGEADEPTKLLEGDLIIGG